MPSEDFRIYRFLFPNHWPASRRLGGYTCDSVNEKKKEKSRYGGGFRKSTPQLVAGKPEETIDCLSTFLFVLHIYYCMHLDPPVDQGSVAEVAVLKTLMGANCKIQLLKSMKTRFQVNPRHLSTTSIHNINPRPCCRNGPTNPWSSNVLKTCTTG